MQVYRGMNIGTAKATSQEQSEVRHHLIDLVDPHETFTLVDFQEAHARARTDIDERNGVPLLVGGTGLYLRAVVDGLTPPPRFAEIAASLRLSTLEILVKFQGACVKVENKTCFGLQH